MKNLIQYKQDGNKIKIPGTNQILDFFISANCLPNKHGLHRGCHKWAKKISVEMINQLDRSEVVEISGHSLGGGIALALGYILSKLGYTVEVVTKGSYPIFTGKSKAPFKGINYIYGNDPVPGLFPWFRYSMRGIRIYQGPDRKWWKVNFKDHVRY